MSKRFTETEKWKKCWFMKLPVKYKCFWFYILDNCSIAGIWDVNLELASVQIGEELDKDEILELFKDKIFPLPSEENKWIIPAFLSFQYKEFKKDSRPHMAVINELKKYGLPPEINSIENFVKGIDTVSNTVSDRVKDKDKEKDKDKNKDKNKDKEKIRFLEYVYLTQDEVKKLIETLGEEETKKRITDLNNYIASRGLQKKYKSHYHTILNWVRMEEQRRQQNKLSNAQQYGIQSMKRLEEKWEQPLEIGVEDGQTDI